jgi:hypothetical protein
MSRWSSAQLKGLNLLVPGVGLVLLGQVGVGLVTGLVTTVLVALTLAAYLLIPLEFHPTVRGLLAGAAGGAYLGVQVRLGSAMRREQVSEARESRNARLREATALLDAGRAEEALAILLPLQRDLESDLHVLYRVAQALTAAGRDDAARMAWEALAAQDRHRLYAAFWRPRLTNAAAAQE